ncbi:MAG: hypothetical protein JWM91_2794 [Rhodospirillales bacterium]|nr:hypothetical protein [Rhodospirillales bacterium]
MPRPSIRPRLTFEDAMSVHVLRAQGVIFSELTRLFGVSPARFYEILYGNLYPGSWSSAVERLTANDIWHPDIALLIERRGHGQVLAAVKAANPNKKLFERELKRLRTSAPIPGRGANLRPGSTLRRTSRRPMGR